MSLYKPGFDMLRCALKVTPLWKSDLFIWTQTSLCYQSRSFTLSHLGRNMRGHTLKQVQFYSQSFEDADNVPAASAEITGVSCREKKLLFIAHLGNCSSPTDVLDKWKQFPSSHHVSSVFSRMRESTKKMMPEQLRCELQLMFEHPGFREVCERVMTDAWRMKCDDLAYTLLAILKLGVSQNSQVVQTLLRVTQERLNQFDAKSLSVLAACIQHMENSSNVTALREALRLLLNDRIPEIQNVVILQNMMRAVGKNSPMQLKMQLATKTLSLAGEFSPPNIQYMFSSLAAMKLSFKPLLNVCSNYMAENMHEFPFSRILRILMSCHQLQYRNYTLFCSISDYMANTLEMWPNSKIVHILIKFEALFFRPVHFLDAFAERIIQKPDSLTLMDLLSVLKVFSFLNHDLKEKKTEFLDSLTKASESYLSKMPPMALLKVVYCMALMGHFPPTLLEKLTQEKTLEQLLQNDKTLNKVQRWLYMLDLCLQLDKPQLPPSLSSIPDLNITVPALEVLEIQNKELLSLVKGIVGSDAVQDNVLEHKVYFIDCVITLPSQKEDTCGLHAKDSGSPECARRIAVIFTPFVSLCFGTKHPRASLAVKLRHLEKLGYKPVLVSVGEFNSKSEKDKIKMLQTLIFPKQETSATQEILNHCPKTERII